MRSTFDFDPYSKISEVFDDGRLVLTDVIGSGSFAVVYMAETVIAPKRQFAVKALFKHGLTPTQVLLQRREAMLLKHLGTASVRNASSKTTNLQNNHIVSLNKTVETEDCIYLVMEWCRSDLYEAITTLANEGVMLSDDAIKHLFGQLVDAVAFCHERGVSHRDLKPENVLISDGDVPENFTLKLTDFGLATTENWTTDYGCGSVRYMAPEVLANDGSDRGYHPALNDIWSLGVILFNMVTGKNPWHTPSEEDFTFSEYFSAELEGKPSSSDRDAYFCEHFGVSIKASRLFGRIFCLDPLQRCSVRELKTLVNEVDSFHLHNVVADTAVPDTEHDVVKADLPEPVKTSREPALSMHRWASDISGMDYTELPTFTDPHVPVPVKVMLSSHPTAPGYTVHAATPTNSGPHHSIDNNPGDLVPPRGPTTRSKHEAKPQRSKRQATSAARRVVPANTKRTASGTSSLHTEATRTEETNQIGPSSPALLTTTPRHARRRYPRSPLGPAPVAITSCQAAVSSGAGAPPSTPTITMAEGAAAAAVQAMPYRRVIQDAASALRRIAAMFEDGRSSTGGSGPMSANRLTAAV